ncbi:hypothetical protein ACFL18_01715 [Patescibacteria group bacterium]
MKRKKIKRRVKRFSLKFLWPIIPAIILIVLVILLSRLQTFKIKKINCQLNDHPCSLKFEPILVNLYNQNIFKLDKKNIISQIQNFDSTLTEINIDKQLPNKININMVRRLPIAQIATVDNLDFEGLDSSASATLSGSIQDNFFTLDKTGEVFATLNKQQAGLPLVQVHSSAKLDIGHTDLTQTIADLINQLNSHYVNFESLASIDHFFIVKTRQGPYAVFTTARSLTSQVASLQYILSNIKIDQSLPTKIDLRFDKPVLTY